MPEHASDRTGPARILAEGIIRISTPCEEPDWIRYFDRASLDQLGGTIDGPHAVDEIAIAVGCDLLVGVIVCRCSERVTVTSRNGPARNLWDFCHHATALLSCNPPGRPGAAEARARADAARAATGRPLGAASLA